MKKPRRRPILEPDRAKLAFLGAPVSCIVRDLDDVPDEFLHDAVKGYHERGHRWAFIVTLKGKRSLHWWLHGFMSFFRDGISTVDLSDGRVAFLTWAAH